VYRGRIMASVSAALAFQLAISLASILAEHPRPLRPKSARLVLKSPCGKGFLPGTSHPGTAVIGFIERECRPPYVVAPAAEACRRAGVRCSETEHAATFRGTAPEVQPIALRQRHGCREKIEGIAVIAGESSPYTPSSRTCFPAAWPTGGSPGAARRRPFLVPKHSPAMKSPPRPRD